MLLGIAVVLLVLWGLGFVAFKVTSWFIHLLLIIALIALAYHFLAH